MQSRKLCFLCLTVSNRVWWVWIDVSSCRHHQCSVAHTDMRAHSCVRSRFPLHFLLASALHCSFPSIQATCNICETHPEMAGSHLPHCVCVCVCMRASSKAELGYMQGGPVKSDPGKKILFCL